MLHRPYEQMYAACEPPFQKAENAFSLRNLRSHFRAPVFFASASMQLLLYGVWPRLSIHFSQNFCKKREKPPNFAFFMRKRAVFLKNPLDFFQILPGFGASGAAWVRKNSGSLRCRKAGVSVLRHQPRRSAAAYSRPIPKRNCREAISPCPGPAPADGTARRWGSLRSHSRSCSCSLCRPFCVCACRLLRWPQIPQQSMPRSGWWERS